MKFNQYNTIEEALAALGKDGFINRFRLDEEGKLISDKLSRPIAEDQIRIVEYHRFSDKLHPDDITIVVAVECADKRKGLLISTFSIYVGSNLFNFISKVKIKERPLEGRQS